MAQTSGVSCSRLNRSRLSGHALVNALGRNSGVASGRAFSTIISCERLGRTMNGPAFRGAEAVHFGLSRAIFGAFCMKRHIFTESFMFLMRRFASEPCCWMPLCLPHVCCRFIRLGLTCLPHSKGRREPLRLLRGKPTRAASFRDDGYKGTAAIHHVFNGAARRVRRI